MKNFKLQICLIPSAWNSKALGDVIGFADYYCEKFDVIVISDLYEDEEVFDNNIRFIKCRTNIANYYIYTADYIIDAGTTNRLSKISSTQKRISVWHGIPYKKMFVDLDKKYISDALNYSLGYELMISPSKYYTDNFLRKSMLYSGEVLEIGSSRVDSIFINEDKKRSIKKMIGTDKKIILYAPTFRKPGKISIDLDILKICKMMGDEYVFAVKLHYLNTLSDRSGNFVDLTYYENINEILSVTDILISDYSSLIFDYSILKRDIILYQYDYDEYTSSRGLMFEMSDFIDPNCICYSMPGLINVLDKIKSSKMHTLSENFYPNESGVSTENIVNALDLNSNNRTFDEIIFLVNDLHQIGGVHNVVLELGKMFKKMYNSKIIIIGINEFCINNESFQKFDTENMFDIKISRQIFRTGVETIISKTQGKIISMQFSAHKALQGLLKEKDAYLMFHGDAKDIINKTLYTWHLESLNNKTITNYKKLLFLTETNCDLIAPHLDKTVLKKVDYVENSYSGVFNNSFKKDGPLVAVTRLDSDKNIFDIIEIFKSPKLLTDREIYVYGDGALREKFLHAIVENNLEKKVIWKGYESNKDVIYKNKSGLVMTPISEGFPMVILEACSFAIPVYTYGSFTSAYEIVDDKVGKIITSNTVSEFIEVLNLDFKHDEINFINHIQKYNLETINDKWINIFKNKSNRYNDANLSIYGNSNNPVVSIIIPFYNNSDVIESCIQSVYNQIYKDIEVILINDGSLFIENLLLEQYPKIKYINKSNEGLGLTRNRGILEATGKYVFFLDSDDTIPVNAIFDLVNFAENNNVMVVGGICERKSFKNQSKITQWYPSIYSKSCINSKNNRYMLVPDTLSTNKIYNRDFLINNELLFETGLYEDKIFISKVYSKSNEIGLISKHVYNWLTYGENSSITSTITYDNFYERLKRLYEIWKVLDEKSKMAYIHLAINHDFRIYINKYDSFSKEERFMMYNEMVKFFKDKAHYTHINYISQAINRSYYFAIIDGNFEVFNSIAINHSILLDKNSTKKIFVRRKSTIIQYDELGKVTKTSKKIFNANSKLTNEKDTTFKNDKSIVEERIYSDGKQISSTKTVYGKRGTVVLNECEER